jgi:hypothetical protein
MRVFTKNISNIMEILIEFLIYQFIYIIDIYLNIEINIFIDGFRLSDRDTHILLLSKYRVQTCYTLIFFTSSSNMFHINIFGSYKYVLH